MGLKRRKRRDFPARKAVRQARFGGGGKPNGNTDTDAMERLDKHVDSKFPIPTPPTTNTNNDDDAEQQQPEPQKFGLAKRLAHNEKPIRDRSIRVLREWLVRRKNIDELEMLKVWKGLFYCFWMSDKPLVQLELAQRISMIQHSLPLPRGQAFLKGGLETMQREWGRIDRIRMDKFMMFVRHLIHHGLKQVAQTGWNEDALTSFLDILTEGPLKMRPATKVTDATVGSVPVTAEHTGLCYHVIDLFFDEFAKVVQATGAGEPVIGALQACLEPFLAFLTQCQDKVMRSRIKKCAIEMPFLSAAALEMENEGGEPTTGPSQQEAEIALIYRALFPWLSQRLFDLASAPERNETIRKELYSLRRSLITVLDVDGEEGMPTQEQVEGQEEVREEDGDEGEEEEEEPEQKPKSRQAQGKGKGQGNGQGKGSKKHPRKKATNKSSKARRK